MKNTLKHLACLAALLLIPLAGNAQSGGSYDLSWSKIAGGGGTSSGGQFTVSGTTGQHDAGTIGGGKFTLEGGFWSGVSVMVTPGAPVLKIKLIAGNLAIISWPAVVTGFNLEYTTTLGSGLWNAEPTPVVDSAGEHTVTVPATGVRCYRLKK